MVSQLSKLTTGFSELVASIPHEPGRHTENQHMEGYLDRVKHACTVSGDS